MDINNFLIAYDVAYLIRDMNCLSDGNLCMWFALPADSESYICILFRTFTSCNQRHRVPDQYGISLHNQRNCDLLLIIIGVCCKNIKYGFWFSI